MNESDESYVIIEEHADFMHLFTSSFKISFVPAPWRATWLRKELQMVLLFCGAVVW